MKRLSVLLLIVVGALAQVPPPAAPKTAPPAAPKKAPATAPGGAAAPGAAAAPAREPGLYAIFATSMGTITAKLFEKETPVTVANFVALARGTKAWMDPKTNTMIKKPLFNAITFHRVIPNFMIQTGDPTATGSHNCGFTIKDEIVPTLKFDQPGRLGMANIGSPNTGGCQFFITEKEYPSLNGGYTLFGQVVEGQENVNKIAHTDRDASDKPRTPVRLISVTIKREGPPPAPAAPAKKSATPSKTGTPATTGTGTGTTAAPKKAATPVKQ